MDVDTGVDDAFAVLFAAMHPDINLLGITCVDGNTNVDQVVANTFKVLDAAGAGDIPVARGAVRPLVRQEPVCRVCAWERWHVRSWNCTITSKG